MSGGMDPACKIHPARGLTMRLNKLVRLFLGIGVFASCAVAFAASAENEYVVVTCNTQGVDGIVPVDDDFLYRN